MTNSFSKKTHIHSKKVEVNVTYNPERMGIVGSIIQTFFAKKEEPALASQQAISSHDLPGQISTQDVLEICTSVTERVLHKNPGFITADPFLVNISIKRLPSNIMAVYHDTISSAPCAFVTVNLNTINLEAKRAIERRKGSMPAVMDDLRTVLAAYLQHELRHHSEKNIFQHDMTVLKNLFRQGTNMAYVFASASAARKEAVTSLETQLSGRRIFIDVKLAKSCMRAIATGDAKGVSLKEMIGSAHNMGTFMATMILLKMLKRYAPNQAGRAQINAGVKNIVANLDKGIEKFEIPMNLPEQYTRSIIHRLSSTDMEGFFREYEIACKQLGIPNKHRLITWHGYKKMMGRAYQRDLEEIKKEGFLTRKVKQCLGRFMDGMISKGILS
ncbi:MAG: hypothetical protein KKD17_00055 [Nanoarchaeota archaeon]|nr:hypothetical protein [Nanoarchaeota archaeon]